MRQCGLIHIGRKNHRWSVRVLRLNKYDVERYFDTLEGAFTYARLSYEGITKCQ